MCLNPASLDYVPISFPAHQASEAQQSKQAPVIETIVVVVPRHRLVGSGL
jgi:hypothetical protein